MRSLARIAMGSTWVKPVGLSRNGSLNTSKLWDAWMTRMGLLSTFREWITILTGRGLASQPPNSFTGRGEFKQLYRFSHTPPPSLGPRPSHPLLGPRLPTTMNLDCGLSLSHFWLPLIKPSWTIFHLFIYLIFNISLHPPSLFIRSLFSTYLRGCITRISQLYHTEEGSRAEMFMVINVPMLCWTLNQSTVNNNNSSTVYKLFLEAVNLYGLPSHVHSTYAWTQRSGQIEEVWLWAVLSIINISKDFRETCIVVWQYCSTDSSTTLNVKAFLLLIMSTTFLLCVIFTNLDWTKHWRSSEMLGTTILSELNII